MRFSSFSLIKSEYAGLDLASSVPACTFFSYFDKGFRAQSPPPAPSNTPEPILPCADSEDDEETVVATEIDSESSDSSTINSVEASDSDRDVFEVNARYPLIVRSTRWRPEAQSIIVRREGSFITTCTIINPIPRGWIPHLPLFSLSSIKLGSLCFRRRAIEATPGKSDEEHQQDDDLFTLEKESEQDAQEITQNKRGGALASFGWTGVFTSANSKRHSAVKAPAFEVDEAGRLLVPPVDVNVTYLVTKEVEVFTDDDLSLLRHGVLSNCV